MKVGITFSTFDLLHAGHIAMLREAKSKCDYLIVGLQSDPTIDRPDTKNKPIQTCRRGKNAFISTFLKVEERRRKTTSDNQIAIKSLMKSVASTALCGMVSTSLA